MLLWNGMVAPLVPFAFRGVIWYQGETNVGLEVEYRDLFPALITGWRTAWAQGLAAETMAEAQPNKKKKSKAPAVPSAPAPAALPAPRPFPFLFVQLANYEGGDAKADNWARLREAQMRALALPATGMAVAIDIGTSKDIHPRNKQEVGRRLALLARAQVYGEGVDCFGPVYRDFAIEGGAIRVRFEHAQIGLVTHGPKLQGFSIAGADKVFHPATARIVKNAVMVSSDAVKHPIAVRYGWANDPQPAPTLYNGAGLPAPPFRTDAW